MQKGLASVRSVTARDTSASLYGGDIAVDNELDDYWNNAGKKGSKKKKQQQQQQQAQQGQQQQQQAKKKAKFAADPGFVNLGYGVINKSEERVFNAGFVQGSSTELEKDYLRLTSAVRAESVRDPVTLARALTMVKKKWMDTQDYAYCCNQLKAIRQDCTVQHLRTALTVEVYETHARIALETGDFQEFAVVQTQLHLLYKDACQTDAARENEFAAYKILHACLMTGPADAGLVTFINALRASQLTAAAVAHALQVRSSLLTTNYALFFSLWATAPHMSAYLMDPLADRMRTRSLRILVSAYRPTLALAHLAHTLAFNKPDDAADDTPMDNAANGHQRPTPTPAQQQACKQYLDTAFEGLLVWTRGAVVAGSTASAAPWLLDCKATHDKLLPTNAQHRMPINSVRAPHSVSASGAGSNGTAASPALAPLAAPHDVSMWIKKDLTGKVTLAAGASSSAVLRASNGTGQPSAGVKRTPLFSPSPSPSPSPPPAPVALLNDAVSRKRRNTQPLTSMSYEELAVDIADTEAKLLAPDAKQKYDDFTLSLMMSRLKALQKAIKKAKKRSS